MSLQILNQMMFHERKKKNKLKTSALQKIMLRIKRQYIDQEKVFAKVHVTKDISEIYK